MLRTFGATLQRQRPACFRSLQNSVFLPTDFHERTRIVAQCGPHAVLHRRFFFGGDVSVGELGVVLVVASLLIGRKDMPVLAKGAGKAVGSVVGHVLHAKQTISSFSEVSDIAGIRQELQDGVAELRSIRQDLYGMDAAPPAGHNDATGVGRQSTQNASQARPKVRNAQTRSDRQRATTASAPVTPAPISPSSSGSDILHQVRDIADPVLCVSVTHN